jgi:plastocyanin
VSFWGDSVPAGAAAVLNAAMAGRTMGDLAGMMVTQPNETFDISFAGAPAGGYKGYCLPHLALGMKIDITVQ